MKSRFCIHKNLLISTSKCNRLANEIIEFYKLNYNASCCVTHILQKCFKWFENWCMYMLWSLCFKWLGRYNKIVSFSAAKFKISLSEKWDACHLNITKLFSAFILRMKCFWSQPKEKICVGRKIILEFALLDISTENTIR